MLVVVATAVVLEVVAFIVYRDSSDGQTPIVWFAIALYAVVLIVGIKFVDGRLPRLRRWMHRRG